MGSQKVGHDWATKHSRDKTRKHRQLSQTGGSVRFSPAEGQTVPSPPVLHLAGSRGPGAVRYHPNNQMTLSNFINLSEPPLPHL